MGKCKLCKEPTNIVFNINFSAVNICENCASSIFIQQATWYTKTMSRNMKEEKINGEIVNIQKKYQNVLREEISELIPIASLHGWKSKRIEIAANIRNEISDLEDKLKNL